VTYGAPFDCALTNRGEDSQGLALKATVTMSVTFSLGVNCLFTLFFVKGEIMFVLSALWAYVWYGVAFLWRPGGSFPHARGGIGEGSGARAKRNAREVRFLPSTSPCLQRAPNPSISRNQSNVNMLHSLVKLGRHRINSHHFLLTEEERDSEVRFRVG